MFYSSEHCLTEEDYSLGFLPDYDRRTEVIFTGDIVWPFGRDDDSLYGEVESEEYHSTYTTRMDSVIYKQDPLKLIVDPRTFEPPVSETSPKHSPIPYHYTMDHDYSAKCSLNPDCPTEDDSQRMDISGDEPHVDVWGIETFSGVSTERGPAPMQNSNHPCFTPQSSKRRSTRAADVKQKEQLGKISLALSAALKKEKARKIRQNKSVKPKNSVETTPSQSDFEEWCSQPTRQTRVKVIKPTRAAKSKKAKSEHSESERLRRDAMRIKFCELRDIVPNEHFKSEKSKCQISKQKILNGTKSFIEKVVQAKRSYKSTFHKFNSNKVNWQNRSAKKQGLIVSPILSKRIKKRK